MHSVTYVTESQDKIAYIISMNLYQTLAAEYAAIFPSSREKVGFAENLLEGKAEARLLDIGCASGEFARQLSSPRRTVTGIDLDPAMIGEAVRRYGEEDKSRLRFVEADMRTYLRGCGKESLDGIFIMGNTLVYLDGEKDLEDFLSSSVAALKKGGVMVIQILNYDNPDLGPGFLFPPVESGGILFSRAYGSSEIPGRLEFRTTVANRETDETVQDVHIHYPFKVEMLEGTASICGFAGVKCFGGYDGRPCGDSDLFRLIVLEK